MLALLAALLAQDCRAAELPAPSISVRIFDFAGVSAEVLSAGLRETKRILKTGGVEVAWLYCPTAPDRLALDRTCREAPGPLTLVIHILPNGSSRRQTEPGAAGFAVAPADGDMGAYAGVFHDRVKQLGTSIGEAAALGTVTAHELGHLLLGSGQHTTIGIMKPDWRHKQIVLASQGLLRFDQGERVRILRNVQRRILASKLKPAR